MLAKNFLLFIILFLIKTFFKPRFNQKPADSTPQVFLILFYKLLKISTIQKFNYLAFIRLLVKITYEKHSTEMFFYPLALYEI